MADENELYAQWHDAGPDARHSVETLLAAAVTRHAHAVTQQKINEPRLEDVIQVIVVAVMTQLDNFRGESKFSTWVHSIAENKANEYLRTKIREKERGEHIAVHHEDEDNDQPQKPIPSEQPKQERQVIIQDIFEDLEEQDQALLRYKQAGLKSKEIAEATGMSVEAVDSRMARLKPKLRRKFGINRRK